MSENFKKIVNAPHRFMGNLRKKAWNAQADTVGKKTAKALGVLSAGWTEFLFWLMKYALLDNHLLRKVESLLRNMNLKKDEQGKANLFAEFSKKYPDLSAHLMYYMMFVIIAGGVYLGDVLYDNYQTYKENQKKETQDNERSEQRLLNPGAENFINQCIALENITCIPLIYTETYREKPVVQKRENVWTHGFGMTWSPDKNGNMTVRDYANTDRNINRGLTPHKPQESRTMDSDIEESQSFLRGHIYTKIKACMKRPITENELYAICVAGYQLEGHVDEICYNLSKAVTPQEIADSFITPNYENYGGTPKRRWVCGMLAAGYISLRDILNADVDNFYQVDKNMMIKNNHFVTDGETIKYIMGLSGSKKTKDVVSCLADGRLALETLGDLDGLPVVVSITSDADTIVSKSMRLLGQADTLYEEKKYEEAVLLYENAIALYPDNMEAYSSLALTYKKLGDRDSSIDFYKKCLQTVVNTNKRMNKNKSLLLDRAVKAATYYNAGMARQEMAKLYDKQGDYVNAFAQYKKAKKNYCTALENAQMEGMDDQYQALYQKAIDNVTEMMKKYKRQALLFGKEKIQEQSEQWKLNKQILFDDKRDMFV